jgi:ribA/ribD-fused uncharacterized protein
VAALAAGRRFRFRPFYDDAPRADGVLGDACFSQWWRSPFEVAGAGYTTAEQFMMAEKARLFGDEAALAAILAEDDPATVKLLGRRVQGYDEARWEAARFEVVLQGSVAKFSASAELRAYLLGTGDDVLVEASPWDPVWGVGLRGDSPLLAEPARWRGRNLLGFALVAARDALRAL